MRLSRVALILSTSLLGLAFSPVPAAAQDVLNREYEIKAAYLWHFGRYVDWPETAEKAEEPFVIGVLGKDPFEPFLSRIAESKTVQGRKIIVRRFESANDYKPCHILFISSSSAVQGKAEKALERLQAALEKTKGSPVLVVSDSPGFARKGAAINFLVDREENRVKLEINMDAVKRAGLKVSARLLGLQESGVVKLVRDEKEPG